jgi:hypothetical protein
MTAKQSPASFITGLFETHLQVANLEISMEFYERILGLELAMKEQARRVAFYWVGEWGKTVLGLWEKTPWASASNPRDQIITQHFAFEIELANLGPTWLPSNRGGSNCAIFSGKQPTYQAYLGGFPRLHPQITTLVNRVLPLTDTQELKFHAFLLGRD